MGFIGSSPLLHSRREMSENILEEANRITSEDRERDYGHPLDNFTQTAELWNQIFKDKLAPGHRFVAEDFALAMICCKLSRHTNKPVRDNLTDIAGYARTIEKVWDKEEELRAIEEARKKIGEVK